jgi:NADH:ubiquinone oxidoreductase subunit F (NADH-binding)
LKLTSICGLGQVVPIPISSVLAHFRAEVDAHVTRQHCAAGICFAGPGDVR